ncbi:hypothetical protein [Thalassobius sp. Cn5-15]|uniref:hypothetical protein n=1 Tax=Thalassobius sp. Cn5-15 TaxID=2917763 RepID=UPI001EF33A17|nr:hypothetical protein [Thalassobius sp. Cn5-15]MCG7492411.1 hypothetical protein [Thalassobius sp. Cn5-15]
MSSDNDLLAQLMADALGSGSAERPAVSQPEPMTNGEGGSPQMDRMPWPDGFLGGGEPRDYKACRAMWASVLVCAIRDAQRERKSALKTKMETGTVPRTIWDIRLLTTETEDLKILCDAADIDMAAFVRWARKEFADVLN